MDEWPTLTQSVKFKQLLSLVNDHVVTLHDTIQSIKPKEAPALVLADTNQLNFEVQVLNIKTTT